MNKEEFLKTLESYLRDFTSDERRDILYDYEEHFRIGQESGKTEQELIEELGDPSIIADQYKCNDNFEKFVLSNESESATEFTEEEKKGEYKEFIDPNKQNKPFENRKNVENVSISVIAAISLIFFNLVFILGPFLGLCGAIIGLFAAAAGVELAGLGLVLGPLFLPAFSNYIALPTNIPYDLAILFGIGTAALGALFLIGVYYVAKYFFKGTASYIKWNIKIIKR